MFVGLMAASSTARFAVCTTAGATRNGVTKKLADSTVESGGSRIQSLCGAVAKIVGKATSSIANIAGKFAGSAGKSTYGGSNVTGNTTARVAAGSTATTFGGATSRSVGLPGSTVGRHFFYNRCRKITHAETFARPENH